MMMSLDWFRCPPLLPYLRDWRGRHTNDASAAAEHNWSNHTVDLPAGLSLQWLGTAGFRLQYQGTTLLIDPFVSRPNLRQVVTGHPLQPDRLIIDRHIPEADAVLVGHTHFDHALDVPHLAGRHGCKVYGSSSLAHLLGLHGLANQAVEVTPYTTYAVGPFEIQFVPSRHARMLMGARVPAEGELTCDCLNGLDAGAYRCGQVWGIHIQVAGVTFYHQGSSDLIEDAIRHRDIDYFLVGIAGRGFTRDYSARILRALSPRVVIPQHHDNFFRPLDKRLGFNFNVNFGGFLDEVRAVSSDFTVRSLDLLQTVGG